MNKKTVLTNIVVIVTVTFGALFMSSAFAQAANPLPTINHPKMKEVITLQRSVTDELMTNPAIIGTAVGMNEKNQHVLVVYLNVEHKDLPESIAAIPKKMDGIPVKLEVTEPFRTMVKLIPAKASGKPSKTTISHTAIQTPPIKLGTSGGWGYDLANGYCCGGTLGSLVEKNGVKYILSNYHVLESDIELGGNGIEAVVGDPVIQPGLIDTRCNFDNAQEVSTLSGVKSLPDSNVDASIAAITSGMVQENGEILEIGTISSSTVDAYINQAVKKSGRTTGLSKSTISGLNATVTVAYDNECAGNQAFTKTFTGQLIVKNRRSAFIKGGDSGSLMVEDVNPNPRAIGLLFAGSNTLAVANPISDVLSYFGATMVGQ